MLKRGFDVVISAVGLVLLSPLLLTIALFIRSGSPGPVLYRARRVGRFGHEFYLYKFRSMVVDADRKGPGITLANDQRITPVGRMLRPTRLDELPQLFNVLRGEMSLVGPRPEDPRYVALYTPEQREVLNVRPGITGLAALEYRHEAALLTGLDWETRYINEIMPAKLAIDLEYVQHATLWQDIRIICRTVFSGKTSRAALTGGE
ncbi:MAG: sugar transferase [Anaerolineae bacterium]|nr:sugar transferase [Anaerolineae bacterium]